jgi:hypothetical protein
VPMMLKYPRKAIEPPNSSVSNDCFRPPPTQKKSVFVKKVEIEINAWEDSLKFTLSEAIWLLIWYLIFGQNFWRFPLKNMLFVYSKSEYTIESVSVSVRPSVRPFTR